MSSSRDDNRATDAAGGCRSSSDAVEFLLGRPRWRDTRLSDRHAHPQSRLGELAGDHGPCTSLGGVALAPAAATVSREVGPSPAGVEESARGKRAPRARAVTRPRPGHADLTGVLKYDRDDARDILERASARETTARVAVGAVCRRLLREFGIGVGSHLVHLGGIDAARPDPFPADINAAADGSPLRTLDPEAEQRMIERIDAVKREGNTLGGICEIVCDGLPVGLGSHVSWDRKFDGRLGAALLSIPAVKGVEMGIGFEAARRTGAEVHDEIELAPDRPKAGYVRRRTNRAGGLEGRHDHG